MTIIPLLLVPLILFSITIVFGFWVRKVGKPYNPLLFNIHKLIALAGVVLGALRVKSIFQLDDLLDWMPAILAAAGISVVMSFATGAVMSINENEPGIALFFHRAGPVIIILCIAGVYFLS